MKSNGANGPAGTTPAGTFLSCPGKEISCRIYIGIAMVAETDLMLNGQLLYFYENTISIADFDKTYKSIKVA
jgi:hypothetical protein